MASPWFSRCFLVVSLFWAVMAAVPVWAQPSRVQSEAFSKAAPATGSLLFSQLSADQSGIDFRNDWKAPLSLESAHTLSFAGGGVAIGDYDGDGLSDVYLSRPFGGGRLYRNLGQFRFKDVTAAVGLVGGKKKFWESGCSWADIDDDGDLDLSVCAYHGANRLFLNEGGKFRDVAAEAGVNFIGASVMLAFSDYDRDGDLDAYLVTNREFSPSNAYDVNNRDVAKKIFPQLLKDKVGRIVGMPPRLKQIFDVRWNPDGKMHMLIQSGQYDRLYRNDGPARQGGAPRFTDVTAAAGLSDNGMGLSATWWDYDHDGFPDLYVANDYYGDDRLYRNKGDGTFEETTRSALPHTPWYSMGTNVADINNDGLLDFMGTDMSGTNHFRQKIGMGDMSRNAWFLDTAQPRQYMRNAIYVNSGAGRFMEAAHLTGLANSDWTWAVKFGDLDCDGLSDLFIANGMTGDLFNSDTLVAQRANPELISVRPKEKRDANLAFRNLGDLKFDDQSAEWGLNKAAVSFGAALGDLDNDGDLDLIVNQFEGPALVHRNNAAGKVGNQSVRIRLVGRKSNTWGIDAVVRIETAAGKQARLLTLSRGFYSSDDPIVHFGIADGAKIDRLTIDWPSGIVQQITDLQAGHTHTITEAETSNAAPFRERRAAGAKPLFTKSSKLRGLVQTEREFNDYERQPLLPARNSQLGPGHAWGDIDNDGDDDLYLGGSKGVAGQLFVRDRGKFAGRGAATFDIDAECEDMAPLFFDADEDGDLDLYVVSGGVECEPGDAILQDRLYINDGRGSFAKATDALPVARSSGSVASAADYDRDGDLDLFIGGRVVPGRYPETATSQLLVNNGKGKFTDATPKSLRATGMVTSALWSDANRDGWIDLLVTHEWGPVKTWTNKEGKLIDVTAGTGVGDLSGWWNSIACADIDNDGDMDYAVGNFGLNTKYHASVEHPALLYYGDMENQGRPRIIEAGYEGSVCFPVRGRSCSSRAMPGLADRFPTFKSFAMAELGDVYEEKSLAKSKKLFATSLESGILLNVTEPGEQPRFEFKPLPRIVQIAPVFGISFTEANGDGVPDLFLAQNFFGPQRETGHMDGGVGLLLLGDGDGKFTPVWPDKSGLSVAGDATSLTTTDLNDDGMPDFFVGVNSGEQAVFEHSASPSGNSTLCLRLASQIPPGTQVKVVMKAGSQVPNQTAEFQIGGGYLSQSARLLFFGLGADGLTSVKEIQLQRPGGKMIRRSLSQLEHSGTTFRIDGS